MFEPTFNRAIKLRQADPRITSDAGALLLREADHRLGLTADLAAQLTDDRDPERIRYEQVELLRQHLCAVALGYAHQDDQDALAHDVALKLAVWDRPGRRGLPERLASQPSDWRLIDRLTSPSNRRALRTALREWVARHQRATGRARQVAHGTLDIDPFPIEVHGRQPGGAYHGNYRQTMYYPLVASFRVADSYESARLGEGFIHTILKRGTFEDRLGEFNGVIGNGLSAGSFAANEASLLLKRLAFNLAGMLWGGLEDASGCGWDLKRVQQTVLEAGARVVEHSRRVLVDVARAAGVLWDRLLGRIARWWQPRGLPRSAPGVAGVGIWGRPPRPRRWVPPPRHAHLSLVLRE
ncbi:MAG: transposase [Planctomycetota bacterium]